MKHVYTSQEAKTPLQFAVDAGHPVIADLFDTTEREVILLDLLILLLLIILALWHFVADSCC